MDENTAFLYKQHADLMIALFEIANKSGNIEEARACALKALNAIPTLPDTGFYQEL